MNIHLVRKGKHEEPPIAEGDATYVLQLLVMWGTADLYEVYDGEKYQDAREFVTSRGGSVRPADGSLTPEEKMQHEDLMDPIIHGRNHVVLQLIKRAMRLANEPNYDFELLAKNTQYEIIRLFY